MQTWLEEIWNLDRLAFLIEEPDGCDTAGRKKQESEQRGPFGVLAEGR